RSGWLGEAVLATKHRAPRRYHLGAPDRVLEPAAIRRRAPHERRGWKTRHARRVRPFSRPGPRAPRLLRGRPRRGYAAPKFLLASVTPLPPSRGPHHSLVVLPGTTRNDKKRVEG